MNLKFNLKSIVLTTALTVGMSLTLVSAKPHSAKPHSRMTVTAPTAIAAESNVVGGSDDACAATMGVATGLAIGALSPCSIICAAGAWYVAMGVGLFTCM